MIMDRWQCFDYQNSIYEPSELNPNIPGYIKKIVLRTSEVKPPPIFRINETPSTIFITAEIRDEIVKNKIIGCDFERVETN